MIRLRPWMLATALSVFSASPVFATNYAVGTCKPGLKSFTTISAAVAAVPANSIVYVCPGTYAEQVEISQPLSLVGLSSGQSDQAIIAAPPRMSANATTAAGTPLAAQVLVTAGPVNIRKITVDGAANGLDGSVQLAGIYYGSGASGDIARVTTRNQFNGSNGIGIYVENGDAESESVTIENSSVHDFDFVGIWLNANVNAIVRQSFVSGADAGGFTYAVLVGYPDNRTVAKVANNVVVGPGSNIDAQAITVNSPSATVNSNTLTSWYYGVVDFGASSYTNNSAFGSKIAFNLGVGGGTFQNNSMLQSFVAIDYNCNSGTVMSNEINDADFGMYLASAGPDPSNVLANVSTIQNGGCGLAARSAMSSARAASSETETLKPARRGGKS
jgi:hypothetical protein